MQTDGSISEGSLPGNDSRQLAQDAFCAIIPTLDEAQAISETLAHVMEFPDVSEVIVVDGGSKDGTVPLAQAAGVRVLHSPPGRGPQMNAGARSAQANNLVFLHADCRLPTDAFRSIRKVLAQGHDAGVFAIDYGSSHPLLRLLSKLSHLHMPWTEFGEATLFVRRARFESVGGFPDWPIMEDCELLRRLRHYKTLGKARGSVRSSPRRFLAQGVLRQQLLNIALYSLFKLGVPPARLKRFYRPIR